ncbi:glutathione synthase [Buchnera aphidicola (Pemphigus obesinymphae)]|uniref:glutathione synthase n=1 Tax=Buchnera aphidicola TaxID=9 RepID=UPI00223755BB|nr:glutathione synthase [Buchnera aphidicola]MCW5196445.1 glutathione synthase [Buchnera aphidicola (Pemphigus obesinymphae)]
MNIKLGIIMDPISTINIKKDSSFAILIKAQEKKYTIYYMEIHDLFLIKNKSYAKSRLLRIEKNKKQWFFLGKEEYIPLSSLDVILMRKDPPVNMQFIYATYILEAAEKSGVLVINKPKSLRKFNEKIFATDFPEIIPDTLITSNTILIRQFLNKHQDIIIKPLDGMGGSSVFRVKKNDPNTSVIIETMTKYEKSYCVLQNYLPEIKKGDKRIFIINGKPFPWCLARIPKSGETRGNLAAGGIGKPKKLNQDDFKIANYISNALKKMGLLFVGIDVIGNKLIEINITSPTGICEIESHCDKSITDLIINTIEKKILKMKK